MEGTGWERMSSSLRISFMLPSLFFIPWIPLFRLALQNDEYTHILFVPFIAMALIYADRRHIFAEARYCGIPLIVLIVGMLFFCENRRSLSSSPSDGLRLSILTLAGLGFLLADFMLCFGTRALRRALFPLLFLLLIVPVPKPMMEPLIRLLQEGSAAFSAILFKLIRLPAFRQDLVFSLPGFDIKIAEQCSGIRSSIALCITSLLAGRLALRAFGRRLSLVMLTVPLVIFKNAVRIVTISTLGVYVSRDFLYGKLHHYSGIPFSILELAIMIPLLIKWRRDELQKPPANASAK